MIERFCKKYIFQEREIEIYIKRHNVFYKVIGFGDDCFVDKKESVIFPNASHDILSKKCEDMLNPIFRNLTILNHNTNLEEIIIEPTTVWLDAECLIRSIADKFPCSSNANSTIAIEQKSLQILATKTANEDEYKENKTLQTTKRTLRRMIDEVMKNYGKACKKETNWDAIVRVIEKCDRDEDGKATVIFDNAVKYEFGLLKISEDKSIITWKGNSKKSKTTKELSYSRKQFFDNHKKILKENGKIS